MAAESARGGGTTRVRDTYILSGRGDGLQSGICKLCSETFTIKSNRTVAEEAQRLLAEALGNGPTCPSPRCANHRAPVEQEGAYQRFGETRSGSRRYRCKACRRTFSVQRRALARQKRRDVNFAVCQHLVNSTHMRRLCAIVGIGPQLLYDKIGFLDRQCRAVAQAHEAALFAGRAPLPRLYLGVDRQEYTFNWGTQHDRRNVVLRAVASADNDTGYVFGMHLDFDSSLEPGDIELQARECNDYDLDQPHRRFARLWLEEDREQAFAGRVASTGASDSDPIDLDREWKAPPGGMQVRSEYVVYGHFLMLRKMIGHADKIRFFMDQDPGMRPACMYAFGDLIRERRADAFFVRIEKDMTQKARSTALSRAAAAIRAVQERMPDVSEHEIVRRLVTAQISKVKAVPRWSARWVDHPLPDMGEPRKAVVHLTDLGGYEDDHLANLYLKASLRGVDRYFMQVRRRIATLERPIATASAGARNWYGYSAYSPRVTDSLMRIFRVTYNYVLVGRDGKTPAMRVGLANKPLSFRRVITFTRPAG